MSMCIMHESTSLCDHMHMCVCVCVCVCVCARARVCVLVDRMILPLHGITYNIEMIHSKRKHDKEARLATVLEGRKDRDKFGSRKAKASEFASSTHKEKNKKKNFMMMKHKLKHKSKMSFVDKQRKLKASLLRSRKFK